MNKNAMMKRMGRGEAKAEMQEMFGKKKPAAKKAPVKKMAKGGGCEIKGKTKGTMVKMAMGGKSC
jgi:hypothetical protein